eukprot:gene5033-6263_t
MSTPTPSQQSTAPPSNTNSSSTPIAQSPIPPSSPIVSHHSNPLSIKDVQQHVNGNNNNNSSGGTTPPSTPESLIVILNKYLNKMISDTPKKYNQVREEIKNVLQYLKTNSPSIESSYSTIFLPSSTTTKGLSSSSNSWIKLLVLLSNIYKLTLETKNTKIIVASVEFVEKLVSGNFIQSFMVDEDTGKQVIDKFIEPTLIHCADVSDEMTLIQITKLVHITAAKFHKYTLLHAFKTLFYIHVNSKQHSNLFNASKTSITQIIARLFRSFKKTTPGTAPPTSTTTVTPPQQPVSTAAVPQASTTTNTTASTPNLNGNISISIPVELQSPPTLGPSFTSGGDVNEQFISNIINDLVDKVQETITSNNNNTNPSNTPTPQQQPQSTPTPTPPTQLQTPISLTASTKIAPILQTIQSTEPLESSSNPNDFDLNLRDSVLVFRLLCDLSLKDISDYDSPELRVRTYSLELISSIFEDFGKFLKSFPNIVNYEIREGLFPSILNSGFSSNNTVFRQSLTLFLYLVVHFRDYLKDDIGQYFSMVILRVLESPHSTLQQRWMVLQVLSHICENSQILVDLYVNYDCSLTSKDVFQKTIEDLSKMAQVVIQENKLNELKVKNCSLECLVQLVKALAEGLNAQKEGLSMKLDSLPKENKFIQQKQFKKKIEEGKLKFKMSAKKGIEYLVQIGAITRDPADIARFLKETEDLDKESIGVFIAEKHNVEILQNYLKSFNFNGYSIDTGLRYFLSYFKLDGEGPKVDRVIENFSKQFYQDNLNGGEDGTVPYFENSESSYILAFAVIMLATDLHNASIKVHMTKPEWLKLNNKNNGGKNFDEAYLLAIYDRIAQDPLRLKENIEDVEDPKIKVKSSFSIDDPQLHTVRNTKLSYNYGVLLENIRHMFAVGWHSILAALSLVLENSEDSKVIQTCLEGLKGAIDLTSLLGMSIEREAFVSSLANFTISEKIRELKQKNMDSLQKLLLVAHTDGNYLEKSWLPVFKAISLLERLRTLCLGVNNPNPQDPSGMSQYLGSGLGDGGKSVKRTISTSDFFLGKSSQRSSSMMPSISEGITIEQISKELEMANHLYVNSNTLSNEAIIFFIDCLTSVSMDEIKLPTPSTFSLQKLVEVAVYNSSRIKLIWPNISDHFTKIGSMHPENVYISSMVIDSLKQLAQKFLDNEESQKDFLKPLELIYSANLHPEVRELILKCIFQLTNGRNSMIKSGWRPIFTIFTMSSSAEHTIASLAFDFVDELIRDFSYITETFFIDYVNCLSSYAHSKHKDLSQKAIDILSYCGVQLANGRVCQLVREEGAASNTPLFTDSEQHISLWFPLLTGLARVISHPDPDLRSYSLDTLFRVLALFGSTFSPKLWELIFRGVLLPIFDNIGYSKGQTETVVEDTKWLKLTGNHAFQSLTEMFINFIDIVCFLLDDMLDLLVSCILQENELLAKTAGTFLIQLITTNGNRFSQLQWSNIVSQFYKIFQFNTPFEIFDLLVNNNNNNHVEIENKLNSNIEQSQHQQQQQPIQNKHLNNTTNQNSHNKQQSFSAPISPIHSPLINPQESNTPVPKLGLIPPSKSVENNLGSSNNGVSNTHQQSQQDISLRHSASLPATPMSLTPPSIRKQSTDDTHEIITLDTLTISNSQSSSLNNSTNSTDIHIIENSNSDVENLSSNNNTSSDFSTITINNNNVSNTSATSHSRSFSANLLTPSKKQTHQRMMSVNNPQSSQQPQQSFSQSFSVSLLQQQHQPNNLSQPQQQQQQNNIFIRKLNIIQSKCGVQLQMVQAINDIAISHYECLNTSQLICLGDCLEVSFNFCQEVFKEKENQPIFENGVLKNVEQQVDAINRTLQSEFRLVSLCKELLETFIIIPNETMVKSSTITQILKGFLSLDDSKFIKNMSIFYEILVQLMLQDSKEIRISLRDILIRMGRLQGAASQNTQFTTIPTPNN